MAIKGITGEPHIYEGQGRVLKGTCMKAKSERKLTQKPIDLKEMTNYCLCNSFGVRLSEWPMFRLAVSQVDGATLKAD